MNVFKTDKHGNPTHYECMTVLGNKATVHIEYDYSNPKKVDAHIYRMVFWKKDKVVELTSPRKWEDD